MRTQILVALVLANALSWSVGHTQAPPLELRNIHGMVSAENLWTPSIKFTHSSSPRFHLHYHVLGEMHYATSIDGIAWEPEACSPVMAGVGRHAMLLENDMWILYYAVDGGIMRAASFSPCGPWLGSPEPVLLEGAPSDWDAGPVTPVTALRVSEELRIYYVANGKLGLATSTDDQTLTKFDDPTTSAPPYANSDPVFSHDAGNVTVDAASVFGTESGFGMYLGTTGPWGGPVRNAVGTKLQFSSSEDGIDWDEPQTAMSWIDGVASNYDLRPNVLMANSRIYIVFSMIRADPFPRSDLYLAVSPPLPVHRYRFETNPGVGVDSSGNADLVFYGLVAQKTLAATGPGANFPRAFQFAGIDVNASALEFASGRFVSGSIEPNFKFTVEALVHLNSLTGCHRTAETVGDASEFQWSLNVCAAGYGPADTLPRELFVNLPHGAMGSGLTLESGTDYYVAMSHGMPAMQKGFVTVSVGFWLQDLTVGGNLQSSLDSYPSFFIGPAATTLHIGGTVDGLIDEVRISDTGLIESELLINYAEDDADCDGVGNSSDNCIAAANPSQLDSNDDGFGNACDPDLDNDGTVNFADLAVFKSAFLSADADADFDGNGMVNFADLVVLKQHFLGVPGPSGVAP